ncbi:hypothetical protein [Gluconacetobacter azotocaptans]|uniref:hypothetical protein n=1 Tax=Gluconacetobacter azotocaptans TaxID=142834 RepID=UPI001C7EF962|nr:hypothetical protein [Gluconacetobacter azotocaptans]GBQ34648.1 hypothetical protein AA13594_2922 [Gluconacetobacter azotocaptans DSM 13594]
MVSGNPAYEGLPAIAVPVRVRDLPFKGGSGARKYAGLSNHPLLALSQDDPVAKLATNILSNHSGATQT